MPKILVADDERNWYTAIEYKINGRKGWTVIHGKEREEILKKAEKENPDVIVLDIIFGGSNIEGIEICKSLKQSPNTSNIPIIIYTIRDDADVRKESLNAGACEYVVKGREDEKLVKIIEKSIGTSVKIKINNEESLTITDPFDARLSPDIVNELDIKSYQQLDALLESKYGKEIEQAFHERPNAKVLVFCTNEEGKIEVVAESSTPYAPLDKIKEIETERKKPCYIRCREFIIEDAVSASWTRINNDFYPTIPIYIGKKEWESCEKVINEGILIDADFDTGNRDILAFNDNYREKLKIPKGSKVPLPINYPLMGGVKECYGYQNEVKLGLQDTEKNIECKNFDVYFIPDWQNSPFMTSNINPRRTAFVGRFLWSPGKLMFSIILNAKNKTTTIQLK